MLIVVIGIRTAFAIEFIQSQNQECLYILFGSIRFSVVLNCCISKLMIRKFRTISFPMMQKNKTDDNEKDHNNGNHADLGMGRLSEVRLSHNPLSFLVLI